MTNKEVAQHIRYKIKHPGVGGPFSWITDACGYEQHIKFVNHRNDNWHGEPNEWDQFCLEYADALEKEEN